MTMDPCTAPDARIRERARAGALRVATFNIRMCVDRYPERRPWVVRALAEQEADVVLLQEVIDGGALGAALGLGQAADLTAALSTERAKEDVVRAQLARAPMSEPSPSYRCYAHSEPASYLTSGFGSFPPALSAVLFRYNPVWHCVQCGAALFNEIFLERLFGRHLMPAFESELNEHSTK